MKLKTLVKYFLIWQVFIIAVTLVSQNIWPLRETFLGHGTQAYVENPILYSRENFDGMHYSYIARRGYGYAQQAFFPLYPNLIRKILPLISNTVVVGILISSVSFIAGLFFLNKLIELDYSREVAKWTIIALLIFPTSFFFTSVYTEGLFFFLTITSFYFARKDKWWFAGILGALAANTRFIGILLLPVLLVEWWQGRREKINLLFLLLIPVGLVSYMLFLQRTTGDYLAFVHVQRLFAQDRSQKLILLYQVFWRYFKILTTVNPTQPNYWTIVLEFVSAIVFLITSIYSFIKQRLSYALFNFMAYIIPTLTGSFVSLPRYVLVCFPSFIILGQIFVKHSKFKWICLSICSLLFIIFTSLFVTGYWVS